MVGKGIGHLSVQPPTLLNFHLDGEEICKEQNRGPQENPDLMMLFPS
jgi:hypothetical protein